MTHRTRVLVVDDNKDMVDSLLVLLEADGYDAKGIYSARTIIADVRIFDPDVIIVDITPGKSGWNAARDVFRYGPRKRPMLIAMVSGEYRLSGELSGFDYYFIKPFDPKVLLKLVASYAAK